MWLSSAFSFDKDSEIIKTIFKKRQNGIDAQPSVKGDSHLVASSNSACSYIVYSNVRTCAFTHIHTIICSVCGHDY